VVRARRENGTLKAKAQDSVSNRWPTVRLGDIGTIFRGNGIKRSDTVPAGFPCLRYGEIYTAYNFIFDKAKSFVSKATFDKSLHIKKGDVVFALTGETEDEIAKALAYLGDDEIAAGGDLAVWTDHGCNPKYLAYLMYTPAMIKAKALASNGQIIVHMSVKKLQQITFPLPPLAEQRKIVAKLEKDLARVEAMRVQFERMATVAEDLFKATLAEEFAKVKGDKVRLGDVCDNLDSKRVPITKSNRKSGKFPYYGASGIVDYVDDYLFDGDYLLVSEDGANLLARSTPIAFSVSGKIWVNNHAHILRFADAVSQAFVEFYFASIDISQMVRGAAQPKLTQAALNEISLPFPPLAVQREIVVRLDAAKARSEGIAAKAREAVATCEKLRKAILAEAFR